MAAEFCLTAHDHVLPQWTNTPCIKNR